MKMKHSRRGIKILYFIMKCKRYENTRDRGEWRALGSRERAKPAGFEGG